MQGNNYGLLVKTIKNAQNHLMDICGRPHRFSQVLSSTKFAVRAVGAVWININRVKFQHYRELTMFRFYFPLFMVLLRVIFKSVCYLCAAFWVLLIAMFCYMFVWKQQAQRKKLRKRLLTISKINIIRWNMYREQFSFTKISFESKVSLNIMSQVSIRL